ncbi:hypothetical protein [Pseudonocardia pini]|uniref:hypothetical protein n=1 Tax=Pseudonocardia pini TaxID=2758030 RepID=UPI0015F021F7|nr:hypothetical protein [Pseudonocardia pini]
MTQPHEPPVGQPYEPPPGYQLVPTPPPVRKRDLRALSIVALVLAILVVVFLSLGGYNALGMVASVVPLICAIVAVSLDQRGRPIAIAALVLSLLPLILYALRIG